MSIELFVRFVDENGATLYGELPSSTTIGRLEGTSVSVLSGNLFDGFSKIDKQAVIKKVLSPLESTPIFKCIGLNYAHHAKEANIMSELSVIIGKDGKNVSEAQALDYVLEYTVGNDVSARNFQIPNTVSGGRGGQFGYVKSFDKFAPIGPAVLLAKGVDPHKLKYTTKVNGQTRQETGADDMIWTVPQVIAHLSRGTTLRKGTVIMTGTPSGVGLFMKPQGFLKDGDVVEIEVEGIGSIANKIVFEK